MGMGSEIMREQRRVDLAIEARERTRRQLEERHSDQFGFAGGRSDERALRRARARRLSALGGPQTPVMQGWLADAHGEQCFGERHIASPTDGVIVASLVSPAARQFLQAREGRFEEGVRQVRTLKLVGNKVRGYVDLSPDSTTEDIQEAKASRTRSHFARDRGSELQDPTASISVQQLDEVLALDPGVRILEGVPGSGKTTTALLKLRGALERSSPEAVRPLVLMPTTQMGAFARGLMKERGFTSEAVPFVTLPELLAVREGVHEEESGAGAALRGDLRMVEFIRGALWELAMRSRHWPSEAALRAIPVNYREQLEQARSTPISFSGQLLLFADALKRAGAADEAGAVLNGFSRKSPGQVLRKILNTWDVLIPSALDLLSVRELLLIHRERRSSGKWKWLPSEVALIDEVSFQMGRPITRKFGHVVVDEAQDVSPMEIRTISRRFHEDATVTLCGDAHQVTAAGANPGWHDWHEVLDIGHTERLAESQRLPGAFLELASQLLPEDATESARSVLAEATPPTIRPCDGAGVSAQLKSDELRGMLSGAVAVIAPLSDLSWLAEVVSDPKTLMSLDVAKGREFDSVVVINLAEIMTEGPHCENRGYVALTRATRTLVLLGNLPAQIL